MKTKTQEKIYLYEKMVQGKASSFDLIRLSLLTKMISQEQYEDFLKIDKEYGRLGKLHAHARSPSIKEPCP